MAQSLIREAWGRGIVHIELLGDLPVGSGGSLEEPRLAARYLGKYAGKALDDVLVADIVRANGATELLTSCVPGDDGPEPFYRYIGFSPTGELDENGEIILVLGLDPQRQSSSR